MKSLRDDYNPKNGDKAFVAADIDVPLNGAGEILETFRLDRLMPTLQFLLDNDLDIIIGGHLGQPNGKFDESLSTKHLKPYFDKHLGENNYTLLENLRFDPREETNDKTYAQELAKMADIYINDNFATSHREHASIVGIPNYLPAYAGFNFEDETIILSGLIKNADHPFIGIIGGAKLESKMPVALKLANICDFVLLGGKLGLEWQGPIPKNIILPVDYIDNKDIGTKTEEIFSKYIQKAKTVLWAGPLGMWEDQNYIGGTESIMQQVAMSSAYWVIGGGDTIAAVDKCGWLDKVDFASTGGGAMLHFLVNETLLGIEALERNTL